MIYFNFFKSLCSILSVANKWDTFLAELVVRELAQQQGEIIQTYICDNLNKLH